MSLSVILDHSIVGQSATTLSINKNREYAACRICGAIFQSWLNTNQVSDEEYKADPSLELAAALETMEWRRNHNRKHSERTHRAFRATGRTMTPEAANKLAPFGLVAINDALLDNDIACALFEAPRAPTNDVETTLGG